MARDDRMKKVQGAGADFLETARARAEEFLKELSRAGGDGQERAHGTLDDLIEEGRKGTEQFVSAIRREVRTQLGALGLVTKADLAAMERRLTGRTGPARRATASTAAAPAKAAGAKKTAAKKTASSKKTASTKKAAPARKPAAAPTGAAHKAAKKTAG